MSLAAEPRTKHRLLRFPPITIQIMAVFAVVSSLQNHCLRAVACQLPDHETSLGLLPVEIKTRLVNLLSKRGLLTDSNLANVSSVTVCNIWIKSLKTISRFIRLSNLSAKISQLFLQNFYLYPETFRHAYVFWIHLSGLGSLASF